LTYESAVVLTPRSPRRSNRGGGWTVGAGRWILEKSDFLWPCNANAKCHCIVICSREKEYWTAVERADLMSPCDSRNMENERIYLACSVIEVFSWHRNVLITVTQEAGKGRPTPSTKLVALNLLTHNHIRYAWYISAIIKNNWLLNTVIQSWIITSLTSPKQNKTAGNCHWINDVDRCMCRI